MLGLRVFTNAFQRFSFSRPSIPTVNLTSSIVPAVQNAGGLLSNFQMVRFMNRNARRPNKANRGKRPVSHCRRHEKRKMLSSVAYRKKIFGFW